MRRVEGGGATGALALRTAWAYIQSGLTDSILVYGGELNGRGVSSATANALFALSADADWEMMIGGTYTAFYAAMMRAHMTRYGTTEAQFAHVAVRNRANAKLNPYAQKPMDITIDDVLKSKPIAEPYKLLDCSLLSDGAAALLLATEDWARAHSSRFAERPPVHYCATGCGSDTMRLGDRYPDITNFRGKRAAAQAAYTSPMAASYWWAGARRGSTVRAGVLIAGTPSQRGSSRPSWRARAGARRVRGRVWPRWCRAWRRGRLPPRR